MVEYDSWEKRLKKVLTRCFNMIGGAAAPARDARLQ
jgi:hypothetical protein